MSAHPNQIPDDPTDFIPLDFGRYRGKTPLQILVLDPSYITWLYENVPGMVTRATYLDAAFATGDSDDDSLEEDFPDADDYRDGR